MDNPPPALWCGWLIVWDKLVPAFWLCGAGVLFAGGQRLEARNGEALEAKRRAAHCSSVTL